MRRHIAIELVLSAVVGCGTAVPGTDPPEGNGAPAASPEGTPRETPNGEGRNEIREPYYGEGRDYLSSSSPIPTDPETLAANVAKWEAVRSGKNTREYGDFGLVMSMTEEQLRAVVPRQTASYKPGCPNCRANGLGRGEITRAGRWFWPYRFDPQKPGEVVCTKCGMEFPNAKFPTHGTQVFYSPSGIKNELAYWEDPESRTRYFIDVEIAGLGWKWMENEALEPLMEAYRDTGGEEYAYRASILMDEVADKFPAYVFGTNLNKQLKSAYTVQADGSKGGPTHRHSTDTRIGYRGPTENMGGPTLRRAYETFAGTAGMQRLSRELGRDVREHYVENVLYLTDSGLKTSDPSRHSGDWKQGLPGEPAVRMGLMLGRPDYLRWYITCQEVSGFKEFYADGGYPEGPGYSCLALNPRSNMRMLNGYTDPPDFEVPAGEARYDNWEYPWGKYYPDGELEDFWRRAYGIWREIALPDGSPPTFNDANHDSRGPSATYQDRYTPLERSRCVLKPNLKHVILGDGEGRDQFQVHMGFGRGGAHAHHDTLGIQLYGVGHYLLDDIPYPKHILRAKYSQALTHNTVTVDETDQSGSHGGDVVFYEPHCDGFSAVRVNATDAYPGRTEVYARTLVAMTSDPQHPYVLDVFRVKGGRVHDYMLYGSSYLRPTDVDVSLPDLQPLPGERPLMPAGTKYKVPKDYAAARQNDGMPHPYGIFTDVRTGNASGGFVLDYRPQNVWQPQIEPSPENGFDPPKGALYVHPDKPRVGSRHHVVGGPNMQAMLAKIARKPTPEDVSGDLPVMILRSQPTNETLFVVVHEPYLARGHVSNVERLPSKPDELAVRVEMPGRTDRIVMSLDDRPLEYATDGLETDGLLAAVSERDGQPAKAWMVGGTRLSVADSAVELARESAGYAGTVANSLRRMEGDAFYGFELAGNDLPAEGTALRGSALIVRNRHPGTWGEVADEGDKSVTFDKTVAGLSLNLHPDGRLELLAVRSDGAPLETAETLHTDDSVDLDELADGLTIKLSASKAGWSMEVEGADSFENAHGEWGDASYADLFRDEADVRLQVADTRERRARLFVDEITVEGLGDENAGVLLRDAFDDGDLATAGQNATHGGFLRWADRCEPCVETDGVAKLGILKGDNFARAGIASQSSFDVAPATGFRATFRVTHLRPGAGRLVGFSLHAVDRAKFATNRVPAVHRRMIRPGLTRIDSDTAEAKRFPVGAGWAFEIVEVRKVDGRTYVVIADDHGLIVTPRGLRELYLPHRILSRETSWTIHGATSTEPLRQPLEPSPIDLRDACVAAIPGGSRSGIVHRILRRAEGDDEIDVVHSEVLDNFDFFELSDRFHVYEGYLHVPADGLYTFHFRPGARGQLELDGKVVSPDHESRYVTGNIVPRRARVRLTRGFVPIRWTFEGSGGGKYGGKGCGFTFEGPGIPRTKFRPGDFHHASTDGARGRGD